MAFWIFTINPGSTSTKTALFCDLNCVFESTVRHDATELQRLPSLSAQLPLRLQRIEQDLEAALRQAGLPGLESVDAFVGRGGLLKSLPSGTYQINPAMLDDLTQSRYGVHASNLGAPIAFGLAAHHEKLALIVDPVSVDEMIPLARYSGLPQFRRRSTFHALNQKATARKACTALACDYQQVNLIIAHLGGGISVAAHRKGLVIDVNNALEEGPFSPERAGTLPTLQMLDYLETKQATLAELRTLLVGRGGLYAYTGTADAKAVEDAAASDPHKAEILQAMAYQISKWIGAMATVLHGEVRAIVLTGGLAYSSLLTQAVTAAVDFIAPVLIFPGENEMQAMAEGAYRVLAGQEAVRHYAPEA